jgi:hypothetical protein
MYIQITTRCNMYCEHCGYACTAEGVDMSLDVYKQSIKFALSYSDMIAIGGGEPTIHPQFWEFLGLTLGSGAEYVWLATNGSMTSTSIALANMAKKGVIGCALSLDSYHDPIDESVIEAFKPKSSRSYGVQEIRTDGREIRNNDGKEIYGGRCTWGEINCICPEMNITPSGLIKECGCLDAPTLGTVFNPRVPEDFSYGECWKDQDRKAMDLYADMKIHKDKHDKTTGEA